ncbi:hypothetical protein QBC43DRAFT_320177 [Cladorrhinum sp. PSN259]|nr:hypothetical protein QBC43DRAFT_320177 [Cladorrhinum sp. PSN259]
MEVAIAVGSLKAAYHLVVFGIKLDQVPAAVRRCLELVRACHYDLADLIKLRNESLSLLETKSAILERVNTIIENANKGLLEVCQLVEKLRPAAHDGHTPLMSRIEWLFFDSSEFTSQEPLIAAQHRSVIAELGFLRQLVLFTPILNDYRDNSKGKGAASDEKGGEKAKAAKWDNLALLDEMLGAGKRGSMSSSQASVQPQHPINVNLVHVQMNSTTGTASQPVPTEPPPPYSPPSRENATVTSATHSSSNQGLPRNSNSTFDADGISLLFGDLKVSLGQGVPSPQPIQTNRQQDFYTAFIQGQETTCSQQNMGNSKPAAHISAPPPPQPQFFLSANNREIKRKPTPQPTQYPSSGPGGLSAPQQLHHRQSMPAIPPQNHQTAQPLSTIPQELIHRYDGFTYSPPPQSSAPFVPSQAAAWNRLQQEKSHQRSGSIGQGSPSGQKIYLQGNSSSSLNLTTHAPSPAPAASQIYLSDSRPQTATPIDLRRASTPNSYGFQSYPTSPQPQPQQPTYLAANPSNPSSPYNQHIHPSQSVSHLPSAHTFPISGHPSPLPAHPVHPGQPQHSSTPKFNHYNSAPPHQNYPNQPSPQPTPYQPQYMHAQGTGPSYQVSPQSTGTSQYYTPPPSSYGGFGTAASAVSPPPAPTVGLGVTQPRDLRSKQSTIDTYFAAQSQLPGEIGYFGQVPSDIHGKGQGGGAGNAQEVRTEIYELSGVKFAPDPVELP